MKCQKETMLALRKMTRQDVPLLYEIALRAFRADYERYSVYPPLLKENGKGFLPPVLFGKVVIVGDAVIGGAFVTGFGQRGEIGAIFIDPAYQKMGYGRQVMLAIEAHYPKVRKWKLETPGESGGLHRFYEALGYRKTGEKRDIKSGMVGFVYEKTI